jgi:hypothetical protein
MIWKIHNKGILNSEKIGIIWKKPQVEQWKDMVSFHCFLLHFPNFSLFNLPFSYFPHHFNWLFFHIFHITMKETPSWTVKRYGKYRRKVSWIVKR